jgi:hypothetical protein
MKRLTTLAGVVFLAASPALAQDKKEGFSLMEEGAKLFLKGIIQEMEPAIEDLRGMAEELEPGLRRFVEEMGPALSDLMGKIDNLNAYHPPEMLPNGDIILRRKTLEEMRRDGEEIEL